MRLDDPRVFSIKEYYRQAKRNKRQSRQYKDWRGSIIKRDGYKCVDCGTSHNLEVHHISLYSQNFWLRLKKTNGITLCKDCHKKRHPWMCKQDRKEIVIVRRPGENDIRVEHSHKGKTTRLSLETGNSIALTQPGAPIARLSGVTDKSTYAGFGKTDLPSVLSYRCTDGINTRTAGGCDCEVTEGCR